tara:strand:- start:1381 stop:2133 length:753 start_codon:yes stop_codon:yes gene_type:complete
MTDKNYSEELNQYFKLKNNYYEKINSEKQAIINNKQLTKKEKQQKFTQTTKRCINCKQIGGTNFTNENNVFRAYCGNTKSPCKLNINIKRQQKVLIPEKIREYIYEINSLKSRIILLKLDFVFNFISEEKSIQTFSELKEKLTQISNKYIEIYDKYLNIKNKLAIQDELRIKIIDRQQLINHIKTNMNLYKTSNNISYVKEIIELYNNDLQNIIQEMKKIQYNQYIVETRDMKNYLVKQEYVLKDLEIDI